MTTVKKSGQRKLFRNKALELLTKTNPFVHVITYGGCIVCFLALSKIPIHQYWWLLLVGVLLWTLTEYLMHRFVFHLPQSKFQYLIHGVHHEFPRDKERLMMPPVPGVIFITLFYGLFFLPFQIHTAIIMAGFLIGYLVYTFIHYMIHAWKPIAGIEFLWTHHHKHHNPKLEHTCFGVSTPIWDYVFGTLPTSSINKK